MLELLKDICIFMMIAQAIVFFVPGKSYMKYVRILVGIMMILRMTEPLFSIAINGEAQKSILLQTKNLEERLQAYEYKDIREEAAIGIYEEISEKTEEELLQKLRECPVDDYKVKTVRLENRADKEQGSAKLIVEAVPIESNMAKQAMEPISVEPVLINAGKTENVGSQDVTAESSSRNTDEWQQLRKQYGEYLGIPEDRIELHLVQN